VTAQRVPLGVDLDAWPPREPRQRTPGECARLIHVASLNRVKDQTTLLFALAELARSGTRFEMEIVGEDTLGGEVQALAGRLGISDRINFHGFVPQRRLRALVAAADLMIMASRHEAGPVAMLEAAVVGVPTVGTAVGHIAEWAPSAATSVAVGDAAALARAIGMLLARRRSACESPVRPGGAPRARTPITRRGAFRRCINDSRRRVSSRVLTAVSPSAMRTGRIVSALTWRATSQRRIRRPCGQARPGILCRAGLDRGDDGAHRAHFGIRHQALPGVGEHFAKRLRPFNSRKGADPKMRERHVGQASAPTRALQEPGTPGGQPAQESAPRCSRNSVRSVIGGAAPTTTGCRARCRGTGTPPSPIAHERRQARNIVQIDQAQCAKHHGAGCVQQEMHHERRPRRITVETRSRSGRANMCTDMSTARSGRISRMRVCSSIFIALSACSPNAAGARAIARLEDAVLPRRIGFAKPEPCSRSRRAF
jgi:hypothetical protein